MTNAAATVTFEKYDTHEWDVKVDGNLIGSLERDRPTRYDARGCCGSVEDKSKAYRYTLVVYTAPGERDEHIYLGEAANLRAAKKMAAAKLA